MESLETLLVKVFRFRFDESVRSSSPRRIVFVYHDEWIAVVIRGLGCSMTASLRAFGWIGGGAC